MRNVALTLAACTLLLGGCHKIVHLSIRNHTTGTYRMELDGDHESRDDIGVLPGRGAVGYDVWVKKKELPEEFELEIGEWETSFRLTEESPRQLFIDVYNSGIDGPHEEPRWRR